MNDLPWLTVLWALPLVGALVTAFVPRATGSALPKQVGLLFALLTLAVGIAIAVQYDTGDGMQLTETHTWIEAFGVNYALGVDGLGLLLILMTVALVPLVLVATWNDADDRSSAAFVAWALALESFSLAVFAA
ncbi:MAG: NADH-quinone oxidoreductase subunit M, partial [Nocardioides sp.]|nr:NADH-quinone oxidoreductase subunit M [Nocardioides sp.]